MEYKFECCLGIATTCLIGLWFGDWVGQSIIEYGSFQTHSYTIFSLVDNCIALLKNDFINP